MATSAAHTAAYRSGYLKGWLSQKSTTPTYPPTPSVPATTPNALAYLHDRGKEEGRTAALQTQAGMR